MIALILKYLTPPILFYSTWSFYTMGEIQILAHSRNIGMVFLKFYAESFKSKFLRSVNEVLFETVKKP